MAEAVLIEIGKNLVVEGVKALAELLISRASEEVRLTWGSGDQLNKLRLKFKYVKALLEDLSQSDNQAKQSRLVDTWLKDFQDAAYMMEDLMDEYDYEIIRRKLKHKYSGSGITKFRHKVVRTPRFFRFRMSLKVNHILWLVDELDTEAKAIGLNQVQVSQDAVQGTYNGNGSKSLNQAREHVSCNRFVGRKGDERDLLKKLCDSYKEDSSLPIVAIVGMGGLGKTTLARHLYDHQNINKHFGDNKIRICVSENFDPKRLLNEMVEALTSIKLDLTNKDGIIGKLQGELKGKKFLLVLDDVWKEEQEAWDSLRESLKGIGGLPGSVILITTRSKKVANAARAVYKHKLKELSEDDSWDLLKQNIGIDDVSFLEEIGRKIANKCKGVPLAINVIGRLLMSKQNSQNSQHEWEAIERSELWELPEGRNHILPSLLLSFNYLPDPSLKQCFAFCAIIPKGQAMPKDILIAHWVAQGFLHIPSYETRPLTEEDIGGEFLSILLNNLFLQEYQADKYGVLWYKMHDLVHDLAVYLSKDLLLIREANDQQKVGDYRHLVFTSKQNEIVSEFSEPNLLRKIRTISLNAVHSRCWWVHARYVRTLVLKNIGLSELPPAIGLLQHLRFLDLSDSPIRMLPDMICKLYHLQTLGLRGCKRLTSLPSLINRLVNLRHVFTTTPLYASSGLAELKNLQTLPLLALKSDQGWTIDELGALSQLRGEICIHGLEHVKNGEQAGEAALYKHGEVMKMTLTWAEDRNETSEGYTDEDVLDGLRPHPAMSSIEVKNFYGKAFPSWIMKMAVVTQQDIGGRLRPLRNLTILKLLNCSNCQTLPTLGQLPFLSTLIMSGLDVEFIGSEFYGSSVGQVFKSLKTLEISSFPRLTTWIVPTVEVTVVFPCLERLQVDNCPAIKAIPSLQCESLTHLRLEKLSSIESLDIIKGCTGLTSLCMNRMSILTRLPDELANCRNLQELKIEYFEQLMSLPSLKSMECLRSLTISCQSLISLPDDLFHGLSALRILAIDGCVKLTNIPTSLVELTSLERISISYCDLLDSIPANLSVFRELFCLFISIYSAVSLRSMLEAAEQLPQLRFLGIDGFKDEQQLEGYFFDMTPFLRLQSLEQLMLMGCSNIRSLPEQLGLLTRITTLHIGGFLDLEEIPDWLCNLSSLETLTLGKKFSKPFYEPAAYKGGDWNG